MKKTIFVWLLLLSILFSLNACNDPSPAESPSESASESEALPELSKEELAAIKTRINEHQEAVRKSGSYFIQTLYTDDMCEADRLEGVTFIDNLYHELVAVDTNENHHSAEIVDQLQKGMFFNEVYEILGAPHYNAMRFLKSVTFHSDHVTYDCCAMYVLNDGRILLIRYTPVFQAKFERAELMERIPDFEEYEAISKRQGVYYWMQIEEHSILSLDDFLGMTFDDEYLKTSKENLPAMVDKEILDQIEVGMTYKQVEELTGTWGRNYLVMGDFHWYLWTWESAEDFGTEKCVGFSFSDDGELIVSKIAD